MRHYTDAEFLPKLENIKPLIHILNNGGYAPPHVAGDCVIDSDGKEYALIRSAKQRMIEMIDDDAFVEVESFEHGTIWVLDGLEDNFY